MPTKSKASATAKNSLKQQLQLKVIEWNAVKDLFEEQSNSNEGLSILRETYEAKAKNSTLYAIEQ